MYQNRLSCAAACFVFCAASFLCEQGVAQIQTPTIVTPISLTPSGYTQNFDTLASIGTSTTLPTGWALFETPPGGDGFYLATDGGSGMDMTTSVGVSGVNPVSDRAFGATFWQGAGLIGAKFTNATGGTISSLDISYRGEEWFFLPPDGFTTSLNFEYSTDATGLGNGTWTSVSTLQFAPPNFGFGPLDGNAPGNFTVKSASLAGLSIANGAPFWIRYIPNGIGSLLAVDDFTITSNGGTIASTWSGAAGTGLWSSATNWTWMPTNGSNLIFSGSAVSPSPTNDSFLSSVGSIAFASSAGSYNLQGSGTGSSISISGGVANNSTSSQAIGLNLSLSAAQQFSSASGSLSFSGTINNSGNLLTLNATSQLTCSGIISGAGGLTKSGTGTAVLGGANTFTGDTKISGGILKFSNYDALKCSTLDHNSYGGTLAFDSNFSQPKLGGLKGNQNLNVTGIRLYVGYNNQSTTYSGSLKDTSTYYDSFSTSALYKEGSGTLTLSGANDLTYVQVDAGTLTITHPDALYRATVNGSVTFGTITEAHFGGLAGSKNITLTNTALNNVALTVGYAGYTNNIDFYYQGVLSGGGSLTKNGNNELQLLGKNTYTGGTVINAGVLRVGGSIAGNVIVNSAGTLKGANSYNIDYPGSIGGNVSVLGGIVAPGEVFVYDLGVLHVQGNYTQDVNSQLQIEIHGYDNGQYNDYDGLYVAGTMTLAGSLNVSLVGGYSPFAGFAIDILNWGTLNGTFDTISLPTLSSSLIWSTADLYTTGVLRVLAATNPGDFNNDGAVNAADYVVWRKTGSPANGYDLWRAHFGQTAGSGSELTSALPSGSGVPEPVSGALLFMSAAAMAAGTRRRVELPSRNGTAIKDQKVFTDVQGSAR